jgi:hypothetical protein
MRHLTPLAVLLAMCATSALAQESAPFTFAMPWDDSSPSITDVSALNPAPLTEAQRITVRDGHFYDQTGRRVRLMGTNIGAGAAFPEQEIAVGLAKRLRKFGINCVRLHHMDSPWSQPNLFAFEGGSYGKKTDALDERSLARLDWLIYQLKLNGIYVDLNLHVGRQFTELDGLPDTDKLPELGKVTGYFEPTMIERQKLFARQLLGHVNPHTGLRYADEPAVAVIEMTNEDTLLGAAGGIRDLPEHYRAILRDGWNKYLLAKHGSTDVMLKAWNATAKPLGPNVLANPQMQKGADGWILETHPTATAQIDTVEVVGATNAPPGRALRISDMRIDQTDWHIQANHPGLDLKPGETYTVGFAGRATADRIMNVNVRLDQAPWSMLGLAENVLLSTNWQRFSFTFQTNDQVVPGHARLTFTVGFSGEDIYLGDLSLQGGGGGVDLAEGQTLESGGLDLPSIAANAQGRDFVSYLMQVEAQYVDAMRSVIKQEIGAKAPVLCSQASYGGLGGVLRESKLDLVDMHAYWQHPYFPNRAWDANDYRIDNTPMVRDANGGVLAALSMHRAAGMPFIVTEYDHPAPSEYAAEIVPLLYAYAAWQDWDGAFTFAYEGGASDKITGFFDVANHPAKMAFYPAAARIFLGDSVIPAAASQTLVVPEQRVPEVVARRTDYSFWSSADEASRPTLRDMLARRTAVRFVPGDAPLTVTREGESPSRPAFDWQSDGGQTNALFTLVTPSAKVLVGDPAGRSVQLDDVEVAAEPNPRNHVTLALTSMDGKPTRSSRSMLLTAIDKAENQGLEWNQPRTFAAKSWEKGPTLSWGISATVSIQTDATDLRVWALSGTGARRAPVESTLKDGRLIVHISPVDKTLWYEIAAGE